MRKRHHISLGENHTFKCFCLCILCTNKQLNQYCRNYFHQHHFHFFRLAVIEEEKQQWLFMEQVLIINVAIIIVIIIIDIINIATIATSIAICSPLSELLCQHEGSFYTIKDKYLDLNRKERCALANILPPRVHYLYYL